ncbi:Glycosyltransferase Family 59 protein [Glomus cerebriforme]|uniref:Dol-P-Glc:Glc(2)Man(9)GlcNAc(2)-PP-Dol alpha-1,2-glucosyltransferase n=1 Tax=Glomus cerebriforme TaxID=658196 RepID=A0A397T7S7_9GLOM|nr:Glycosyltransferase Family 59 protein [Glomus cerebriforme]
MHLQQTFLIIHTISLVIVAYLVNDFVPEPYMDEIFHVSQAKQYCKGNFYEWNPKLTTPPGLYIISNLIIKPLSTIFLHDLCSINFLRAINILFGIGLYQILWKLIIKLNPFQDRDLLSINALILSIFPVGWFYNFLYYTDSGSTFFVLWSYLLSLEKRYWMSALVGGISVLFRQTNIIWVCFILGTSLLAVLSPNNRESNIRGRMTYYRGINIRPNIAIQEIKNLIILSLKNFPRLSIIFFPYFLILSSFIIFLKWNGGIVLGDKSNHIAVLHIPQIFYFISFTAIFSAPIILKNEHVERLLNGILKPRFNRKKKLYLLIIAIIMIFVINQFTFEHPFLLSDNRHYTFYIWKNIYRRHYLIKYLLIPAYMVAGWILIESIALQQSFLWILIYIMAVCLSLVPSPLLEFRYFIIPYYIFRLHIGLPSGMRLIMEFLVYATVNYQTGYLFLQEPFVWLSEMHKWQRFMW